VTALGFILTCGFAWAQPDIETPQGRSIERQRIETQRIRSNSVFDARDAECKTRFVVTSCRSQVRFERIRAEDEFKRQEAILNRLDRQVAAAKQLKKLEEKTR
jgi:hypothetical protein